MTSVGVLPETRHSLLMRLVDSADLDAWTEFTATYESAIYRYARRRGLQDADAREVVQQVLVAVHKAIAGLVDEGGKSGFRAWLFETARRQCLYAFRMRTRFDRASGGSAGFDELNQVHARDQVVDPNETSGSDDRRDWAFSWAVTQVEREVAPTSWKAFWLTAVEAIPAATVAELLQTTIGSVYVAKCRVLAKVREKAQALLEGAESADQSPDKTSSQSTRELADGSAYWEGDKNA